MKKVLGIFAVLILLTVVSCSSGPSVGRVEAGTSADLSGYWNANDVREVCEVLINQCLESPRVDQAIRAMGGRTPTVLVGRFRNNSSEHIDTAIITSTMETAIFNSGKMDFVAGGDVREELRAERQDQAMGYTDDNTMASMAGEVGADFMLFGTVRTVVDRSGNRTVRTYYVNAEMTHLTTNQRVWMGEHQIQKEIVQPRNRL